GKNAIFFFFGYGHGINYGTESSEVSLVLPNHSWRKDSTPGLTPESVVSTQELLDAIASAFSSTEAVDSEVRALDREATAKRGPSTSVKLAVVVLLETCNERAQPNASLNSPDIAEAQEKLRRRVEQFGSEVHLTISTNVDVIALSEL